MGKKVVHYLKLYEELEKRIISGIWSGKLPSQSQLINEFQVSHNTNKKVLDQLKTDGLVTGHQGKGVYVVERKAAPSSTVGLWIPNFGLLEVPFFARVTASVRAELARHKAEAEFFTDLEQAHNQHYCGLLLFGASPDNMDMEKFAAGFNGNIIQVNNNHLPNLPAVFSSNLRCGYLAIEHLYKAGHRNIAVFTRETYMVNKLFFYRWKGAEKFADQHPDVKLFKTEVEPQNPSPAARTAVGKLLDNAHDITAIFAFNDVIALGVLSALQQRQLRVPDDISLISVDNRDFSSVTNPPLTTFNEDAEQIGKSAVAMLYNEITDCRKLAVEPHLIERASVKNIN